MDRKFISERYARIRLAHNISARKLSFELGQSSEYINQIEAGKSMPSIEGLINFCEYFNITLGEFFDQTAEFPVQYKSIIAELNKMDAMSIALVLDLLKLINANKQ
ncbi:MAG: helix-turn-helix domain-containing protein [Clostridiales bacterium]|nr:helix-turn-helix domain-containing protein [Clostridiales bacterium]